MRQGALEQKESLVEEKESWMFGLQEARTTVMDETLNEGIVTTMKKTINAGTYLLLDSTDGDASQFAILRSPVLASSKQYRCLSFYYHM